MLDGELIGGSRYLVHEACKLRWVGMRITARKAAADIDGIDHHAGRHDQLADLPKRLAEGGGVDRLRSHMEGDSEPARDLPRAQQERGGVFARRPELTLERDEAVGIGTGDAEKEIEVPHSTGFRHDLVA